MPLVGFKCPTTVPSAGEEHNFDHCVNKCQHQCFPRAVLATIIDQHSTNPHTGGMLSATTVQGCPRKVHYTRLHDYYAEPQHFYYSMRGTIIHGILDREFPDSTSEARLYKEIGGYVLSGQIDHFRLDTLVLEDYKTMADKGIFSLLQYGLNEKYIWQLNVYRWLMNGGRVGGLDGEQVFWLPKRMVIHHITMNSCVTSGNKFNYEFYENREPKPYKHEVAREILKQYPRGGVKIRITGLAPEVPIFSDKVVEDYLLDNLKAVAPALEDKNIAPEGWMFDDETKWACDYCEVRGMCEAAYIESGRLEPKKKIITLKEVKTPVKKKPALKPKANSGIPGVY